MAELSPQSNVEMFVRWARGVVEEGHAIGIDAETGLEEIERAFNLVRTMPAGWEPRIECKLIVTFTTIEVL